MAASSLQDSLSPIKRKEIEETPFLSSIKPSSKGKANFQPAVPQNLPPSYFVSATYDAEKGAVCIKLYEPKSAKIYFWYSGTEHRPYCLTNLPPQELEKISRLTSHLGFDHFESVRKYDPLLDREVNLTKVVAKDPSAIGGRAKGCIRDIIPEDYPKVAGNQNVKVWEAFIKYYQCYLYDQDLAPGMIYRVANGSLVPVEYERSEDIVNEIRQTFQNEPRELLHHIENWARLLECPVPDFRRVALDIEVLSPVATRVPDPTEAAYEVICASLLGSDGVKRVLLLKREGVKEGAEKLPPDVKVEYYNSERELLLKVFEALWDYPFVITFNGDDFDLRYLWRRAQNLNFRRSEVPIEAGRRVCLLTHGIHLDLYKFFFNRSIQVYAFSQKYRGVTLDELGEALLGKTKIELTRPFQELTYTELAQYCLRDAEITLGLTTFDDNLVMKLILALTRISRMPMEDVTRQGVSRWIRSFLQYEHRRRNMLIPNAEDILALKGKTSTKAIIKGKKYKGAIVVEPKPGVHLNVAVMDFASLYPSIIKVYNLGYQTILCPHRECEINKVPDTPHWICTKRK
ncbi:MAG: 3'-5' exonuclease, partial [Candidatus Bathyarchaeia archaeon]